MIYIDANVVASYIDEAGPSHRKAVELITGIEGKKVVSRLTLTELALAKLVNYPIHPLVAKPC